jgi:serine/threonine-protein kinase HipA
MSKRCPITYQLIPSDQQYSSDGLKLLSPKLSTLLPLPFTAQELRREATKRADKLSVQGVQYKVSAKLNVKNNCFDIVDQHGTYILKPQSDAYPHLPENEDLTMRLASTLGIEIPIHGMIYGKDNELTYFIKRFDRTGRHKKLATEDFSQLAGQTRDLKYLFSMEKLVKIIDKFTTFPQREKQKLFIRTLFNFTVGNEDMHLKNFSLITRNLATGDSITELSPAYDFINSILAVPSSKEEIALPLNGKKNNLRRKDFIDYFGHQILALSNHTVSNALDSLAEQTQEWDKFIAASFLTDIEKEQYMTIYKTKLKVILG